MRNDPTTMEDLAPATARLVQRLQSRVAATDARLGRDVPGRGWGHALARAEAPAVGGTGRARARQALLARLGERDDGWERFDHYQAHGTEIRLRPALGLSAFSGDGVIWLNPGLEDLEDLEEWDEEEEFVAKRIPATATTRVIRQSDREQPIAAMKGARRVRGLDRARRRSGGPAKVRSAVLDRVLRIATASGGVRAARVRRAVDMLASRPIDEQEVAGEKLLRSLVGSERAIARTWEEPVGKGARPVERVATRLRDAAGRIKAVEQVRRSRRAAAAVPSFARPGAVARDGSSPLVDAVLGAEIPGVGPVPTADAAAPKAAASKKDAAGKTDAAAKTAAEKATKAAAVDSKPATQADAPKAPAAGKVVSKGAAAAATRTAVEGLRADGSPAPSDGVTPTDAAANAATPATSADAAPSAERAARKTTASAAPTSTDAVATSADPVRADEPALDNVVVRAPSVTRPGARAASSSTPTSVNTPVVVSATAGAPASEADIVEAIQAGITRVSFESDVFDAPFELEQLLAEEIGGGRKVEGPLSRAAERSVGTRLTARRRDTVVDRVFMAAEEGSSRSLVPRVVGARLDLKTRKPFLASPDETVAIPGLLAEGVEEEELDETVVAPRKAAAAQETKEDKEVAKAAKREEAAQRAADRAASRTPATNAAASRMSSAESDEGADSATRRDSRGDTRSSTQLSRVAERVDRMVRATQSDDPLRGAQAAGAPEALHPSAGARAAGAISAKSDALDARVDRAEARAERLEEGVIERIAPTIRASRRAYYVDTTWAAPKQSADVEPVLDEEAAEVAAKAEQAEERKVARKAVRAREEAIRVAVERDREVRRTSRVKEERRSTWRRAAARRHVAADVDGLGVARTVPAPVKHVVASEASPLLRRARTDKTSDPATRVLSRWSDAAEAVAPVVAAIAQQVALEGGGESAIVQATAAALGVSSVEAREIVRSVRRSRITRAREALPAALRATTGRPGVPSGRPSRQAALVGAEMVTPQLTTQDLEELDLDGDELLTPAGSRPVTAAAARAATAAAVRETGRRTGRAADVGTLGDVAGAARGRTARDVRDTPATRTRVLRIAGRDVGGVREISKWRRTALPAAASFTLLQSLADLGVDLDQDVIEALLPNLPPAVAARLQRTGAVRTASARATGADSASTTRSIERSPTARSTGVAGVTGASSVAQRASATGRSSVRSSTVDSVLRRVASASWRGSVAVGVLPSGGLPAGFTIVDENGVPVTGPAGVAGSAQVAAPAGTAGVAATGATGVAGRAQSPRAVSVASQRAVRALPATRAAKHEWNASAPVFSTEPEPAVRPLERILGATPDEVMGRPWVAERTAATRRSTVASADVAYLASHGTESTVWSEEAGGYVPVSLAADPVAALEAGYGNARRAAPSILAQAKVPGLAAPSLASLRMAGPEQNVSSTVGRRRDSLRRAMTRASDPMALARVLVQHPDDVREIANEMSGSAAHLMREIVSMTTLPEEAREVLSAPVVSSGSSNGGGRTARSRGMSRRDVRANARRALGMSGGAQSTASSSKGVGESRLSKLSKKLQSLIHLAENDAAAAANRVRRSDDVVEAPADSDNAIDSTVQGVTLAALQREVLGSVMNEVDGIKDRREGGPNVDIWW